MQFWLKTHFASTTFLDFHVCQSGRGSTNSIMHISNVSREQILHSGVNRQKYQAVAPGKTVTLGTRNTEQAAYGRLAMLVGQLH